MFDIISVRPSSGKSLAADSRANKGSCSKLTLSSSKAEVADAGIGKSNLVKETQLTIFYTSR